MAAAFWKIKPPLETPSQGVWIGAGIGDTSNGVWIGRLAELTTGKTPQVWLATGKEQVVAVVGKRGSGKSFTLGVIAEGLCQTTPSSPLARQPRRRATLLFDPLDIYWTTRYPVAPSKNSEANRHYELAQTLGLSALACDVQAWVPGSENRSSADPGWFQTLQLPVPMLGLEEWELLLDLNILSDPMGQALADSVNLVRNVGYHRRGTLVPRSESYSIISLVDALNSDELTGSYHAETLRAIRQRLTSLDHTGLFSAAGTPISQLLSSGRLSVVLLGRLSSTYRTAVVALLTRMVSDARSRAAFAEKRLKLDPSLSLQESEALQHIIDTGIPRTIVALDEAQMFLAPGTSRVCRDVFVRLVKEGRNVGLSAVIATQQPSAIDQRVLSQVETFISHQLVTEPDIRAIRENLKSALPTSVEYAGDSQDFSDVLRKLSPGQCFVSSADMNTNTRRGFVMTVRPRASIHGGIEL